jgi:hypothetical protein
MGIAVPIAMWATSKPANSPAALRQALAQSRLPQAEPTAKPGGGRPEGSLARSFACCELLFLSEREKALYQACYSEADLTLKRFVGIRRHFSAEIDNLRRGEHRAG